MERAINYLKEQEKKLSETKKRAEAELIRVLTEPEKKGFLNPDTRKKYACEAYLEALKNLEELVIIRLSLEANK